MKNPLRKLYNRAKGEPKFGPFLIGMIIFLTISLLFIIQAAYLNSDPYWNDFLIAMSSAFAEDIIFFTLVGGVITYLTLASPGEARLDRRLQWLFNSVNSDPAAISHIKQRIIREGIFCPKVDIDISFNEVNSAGDAISVSITCKRTFANLFGDHAFAEVKHEYGATPDIVMANGEANGEIVSAFVGYGNEKKSILKKPIPIFQKEINIKTSFRLEANGLTVFEHAYWCWFKVDAELSFNCHRYTSEVNVRVTNEGNHSIEMTDLRTKANRTLTPDNQALYRYEGLPEGLQQPFKLVKVI